MEIAVTHTHVKICGITNPFDARVAIEAGADMLGFILYPKSPRYVMPEMIAEIIREMREERMMGKLKLPPTRTRLPAFIGVFVNESAQRVDGMLAVAGLDYAQLHGDESPEMVTGFGGRAFKALRPADAAEAKEQAQRFASLGPADGPRWMIDAYDPDEYGGTGKRADWHVAADLARRYPGLLLAGGLTPDNVAAAVRAVRPWGVDVSSGVEVAPGKKDHAKVRAFVEQARQRNES